jgi:cysteine-rich repeat protein
MRITFLLWLVPLVSTGCGDDDCTGVDAGADADSDTDPDDGFADDCVGQVGLVESSPTPFEMDLTGFANDLSAFESCGVGAALTGVDGFFEIYSFSSERWHITVTPLAPLEDNQDVAVYVLTQDVGVYADCDERTCYTARDGCGANQAEQANFVTPYGGSYFVGIESSVAAPVRLLAINAPCGDAVVDDGETCDDGNGVDGDGCDSLLCRAELSGATDSETEPNDEALQANVVRLAGGTTGTISITGTIGGGCDHDRYALLLVGTSNVRAVMLDEAGNPCTDLDTPPIHIELHHQEGDLREDGEGESTLGEGETGGAGDMCPSIEAAGFAQRLTSGEYQVVVRALNDIDVFNYMLQIEVTQGL